MIFFITTVSPQGEFQECTLGEVDLEVGLSILDNLSSQGHQLHQLTVLEAGRLSDIPVEAWATAPQLPLVHRLQTAWQQVLGDAVRLNELYRRRLLGHQLRQVQRHHHCIACLEGLVEASMRRLERVAKMLRREPQRSRTLRQLETTLERHQQALRTEQRCLQQFLS